MHVKCQSCGAPQSTEVESNCNFCGIQLDSNNEISVNDFNEFTLAQYEYNNSRFPKALLLFEEILKDHKDNIGAWIYKVDCELRINTANSENYKEFEHSANWLFEKFGNDPVVQNLIEDRILATIEFLFKLRIERPIPKMNQNNVEGFLESHSLTSKGPEKEYNFLRVINRLSSLFSSRFSVDFLRLLTEYIHNLENNNSYNKKRHSRLLNEPAIFFELTALFHKSGIDLTDFFIKILKSLENSTDDDIALRDLLILDWSDFSLSFPKWYFTEVELQEINNLDINYKKIEQYLKTIKKDEVDAPALEKETKMDAKKGCFIATAAMGDYNHPVVVDLRIFRDNWLLKRHWGVSFTNWYYTHGPKAARVIKSSDLLKKVTYFLIVKPLQILTKKLR